MLNFGTARARVGYAFDRFLVYGAGGLAWSYDRLERTQLAGGMVGAGTTETAFLWRWGWAAGAGVEFPVAPNWTGRVEYLATGFGDGRKSFPAAGQAFDSDLTMQSLRVGVNYQLGVDPLKNDAFTKGVRRSTPAISRCTVRRPSLSNMRRRSTRPMPGRTALLRTRVARPSISISMSAIARGGARRSGSIPKSTRALGSSGTFGVAGFPSAEAYKVGQNYPYARIPRAFLRQTIDLGGESQKVDAGISQFAGTQTATAWSSPSANSAWSTSSTRINMPTIRATTS